MLNGKHSCFLIFWFYVPLRFGFGFPVAFGRNKMLIAHQSIKFQFEHDRIPDCISLRLKHLLVHKPEYTRRGCECSTDDNSLGGCRARDGPGQRVIVPKGYYVHVPRSTFCYNCGPCTKDGMTCTNLFRLD